MLHILIKLLIVFIIIFIIKNIHDINKFNPESNIININNTEYIKGKENILDPLIIEYDIIGNKIIRAGEPVDRIRIDIINWYNSCDRDFRY